MDIVLATVSNPLVRGGATFLFDWLTDALETRGHRVNPVVIPFSDAPDGMLAQLLALRLLDLSQYGDQLITIRTPSHLLRHPNKRCWFIHHFRSAYDLWGTKYQTLPHTIEGSALRRAIVSADIAGLQESKRVFCNSVVVQDRLKRYNAIHADVLYPPLPDGAFPGAVQYGDFLLYFCRLSHHKRQWLAIEALRHSNSKVRLVIAGAPDPGCEPYVEDLRLEVARLGLQDRVTFMPYWIDDDVKQDLFSKCLAVVYFPFDEDSYGYPSLEANSFQKAVLTTSDAGGTIELVENGRNGLVTPPDPQLIGEAMDSLFQKPGFAQALGVAGPGRIRQLGIDWDHVVEQLTS